MAELSLRTPPLFEALESARHVLVAGAGGGFDVYAGLPLALALLGDGKQVSFANLTFTDLDEVNDGHWISSDLLAVEPGTRGPAHYFPERTFARWLAAEDHPQPVYTIRRTGPRHVRAAYQALLKHLAFDALVLVDGGTDILMCSDEAGLGTPERTSPASSAPQPPTSQQS